MARYIINRRQQDTGEHEVHNATTGCSHLPNYENQVYLGEFRTCHDAVAFAKRQNPLLEIDGCFWCSRPCHTR